MKPINFTHSNTKFAEHQDEYLTLPAHIDDNSAHGRVTTCWQLTWKERIVLFWEGKLWLQQLTFHERLQPQLPRIDSPFIK